jgi:hypothetical protein
LETSVFRSGSGLVCHRKRLANTDAFDAVNGQNGLYP